MTEQLALEQLVRERAAVEREERLRGARRSSWIVRAKTSLPTPVSPRSEHGEIAGCDPAAELVQLPHRVVFDDDVRPNDRRLGVLDARPHRAGSGACSLRRRSDRRLEGVGLAPRDHLAVTRVPFELPRSRMMRPVAPGLGAPMWRRACNRDSDGSSRQRSASRDRPIVSVVPSTTGWESVHRTEYQEVRVFVRSRPARRQGLLVTKRGAPPRLVFCAHPAPGYRLDRTPYNSSLPAIAFGARASGGICGISARGHPVRRATLGDSCDRGSIRSSRRRAL